MMKVNESLDSLANLSILKGDSCYLITKNNEGKYFGLEPCFVVTMDGKISPIIKIGSYVNHSGSNIFKLKDKEREEALMIILEKCDLISLRKALSNLIISLRSA